MAGERKAGRKRARGMLIAGVLLFCAALAVTFRDSVVGAIRTEVKVSGVAAHREVLREAAEYSGLDPYLLAGLVANESGGDVDAVSGANALGLFQLRLATAVERAEILGLPEPTRETLLSDARANALIGSSYLAYLLERYDGELEAALAAYNTGPTRLDRWIAAAGDFDAWRSKQERDGDSMVLSYARNVQRYAEVFRRRGLFDG